MLSWLKSILGGTPRARKIIDLEAKLLPAEGYVCDGDFEFEAYDNDDWSIEIEVDHNGRAPDGPWRVLVNGRQITEVTPSARHETEVHLRSDRDALNFQITEGMTVELHNAKGVFLRGTLRYDT